MFDYPYLTAYRQALKRQYDAQKQKIDQQKNLDYANIMSTANRAGVMYSNFPARSKAQYETSTYLPNYQAVQSSYQTGLDKIRSNVLSYANQIKNLEEAIRDLNSTS